MSLPSAISNYIDLLHRVHRDNSTFRHFAEDPDANIRSTMYLTPFVYQFFIYNSLYQVDWPASIESGVFKYLPAHDEERSQNAFEEFLQDRARPIPDTLNRAFADIEALTFTSTWMRIVPDALITEEQGTKFFGDLRAFQVALRRIRKSGDPKHVSQVFSYIHELRPFIYRVRCNIFHGRKSLAEAVEPDQNKRIELYYRFLNSIVTLFFIVMEA